MLEVAHGMLIECFSLKNNEKKEYMEVEQLQRTVQKRKSNLVTNFFTKKDKKQ